MKKYEIRGENIYILGEKQGTLILLHKQEDRGDNWFIERQLRESRCDYTHPRLEQSRFYKSRGDIRRLPRPVIYPGIEIE